MSMAPIDFAQLAQTTECHSVEIAQRIVRCAISKSGDSHKLVARESEEAERQPGTRIADAIEDILPTPPGLRLALELDSIKTLLQCRCQRLCGLQWAQCSPREDAALAETIFTQVQANEAKLQDVAIFVLSGTSFVLRHFQSLSPITLDRFLRDVEHENTSENGENPRSLPRSLFERLQGGFPARTIPQLTDDLLRSVDRKIWLVNVPFFSLSSEPKTFNVQRRKYNFPFVSMGEASPANLENNRQYLQFQIAKGCADEALLNRPLFRKLSRYQNTDRIWRSQAENELQVLKTVNRLGHANIAKMLFTFEETSAWETSLSVVFPLHLGNLGDLLFSNQSELVTCFENVDAAVVRGERTLWHGLWLAMQGIVAAVTSLHDVKIEHHTGQRCFIGHFDIKPENILIERSDTGLGRLLLTDFDRAVETPFVSESDIECRGGPGTPDYAPPEAEASDERSTIRLRPSYDVWSLGCVLLEVLVHIVGPDKAAKAFREQRRGAQADYDAGFWTKDANGAFQLRTAVDIRLGQLENSLGGAPKCLRRMLHPDHNQRPRLLSCVQDLKYVSPPSRNDWLPRGAGPFIDLSRIETECDTPRNPEFRTCDLHLSGNARSDRSPTLMIVIERNETDRWNSEVQLADESFCPLAFFSEARLAQTEMICAFANVHRDVRFRFQDPWEYSRFFTLLTYHRIVDSTIDIRFKMCVAETTHFQARGLAIGRQKISWSEGRVQLWTTDDEHKHLTRIRKLQAAGGATRRTSSTTVATTPSIVSTQNRNRDAMHSRFKLAFYATRTGGGSTEVPVCLIFKCDTDNIAFDKDCKGPNRIAFKKAAAHDYFPAAHLRPSIAVGSSEEQQQYPGIPLDPERLNHAIRHTDLHFRHFVIEFDDEFECRKLDEALREKQILWA